MELKISSKGEYIAEAFGWKHKDFLKVRDAMVKHATTILLAALKNDKVKAEKMPSKTTLLGEFLASKEFKALKIKLSSANDYFVLGYIFSEARKEIDSTMKQKVVAHVLSHVLKGL